MTIPENNKLEGMRDFREKPLKAVHQVPQSRLTGSANYSCTLSLLETALKRLPSRRKILMWVDIKIRAFRVHLK